MGRTLTLKGNRTGTVGVCRQYQQDDHYYHCRQRHGERQEWASRVVRKQVHGVTHDDDDSYRCLVNCRSSSSKSIPNAVRRRKLQRSSQLPSVCHAFASLPVLHSPPVRRIITSDTLWACVGSFTTLLLASSIDTILPSRMARLSGVSAPFVVGTLGTLCTGRFAMQGSRVMRLKNIVLGHIFSSAVVIAVVKWLGLSPFSKTLAMDNPTYTSEPSRTPVEKLSDFVSVVRTAST